MSQDELIKSFIDICGNLSETQTVEPTLVPDLFHHAGKIIAYQQKQIANLERRLTKLEHPKIQPNPTYNRIPRPGMIGPA